MPIYAYRCGACGHAKDVLQKLSDPVLTTCPACGAEAFTKQVTAAGFQLKGSGWYVTDFRGGNQTGKDGAKDKAEDASEGAAPAAAPAGGEGAKTEAAKAEPAKTAPSTADTAAAAKPPAPAPAAPGG